MKTKLFLLAVITVLLFNSCSSDDSSSPSIVGVWKYNRQGSVVGGEEVLTPYSGNEAGCDKDKSQFTNDGVVTETYFTSLCEAVDHSGTYTKSGNTIVTTFNGNSFTFTILQLTSTLLKVQNAQGNILEFIK